MFDYIENSIVRKYKAFGLYDNYHWWIFDNLEDAEKLKNKLNDDAK